MSSFDHDLQHRSSEEIPEMIFYVSRDGEVEQVDVFLDDRMRQQIQDGENPAWQGLIEFVEDTLANP